MGPMRTGGAADNPASESSTSKKGYIESLEPGADSGVRQDVHGPAILQWAIEKLRQGLSIWDKLPEVNKKSLVHSIARCLDERTNPRLHEKDFTVHAWCLVQYGSMTLDGLLCIWGKYENKKSCVESVVEHLELARRSEVSREAKMVFGARVDLSELSGRAGDL